MKPAIAVPVSLVPLVVVGLYLHRHDPPELPELSGSLPPPPATAAAPRPWPADWPSLDQVLPQGGAAIQTMGTGLLNYTIPGAPSFRYTYPVGTPGQTPQTPTGQNPYGPYNWTVTNPQTPCSGAACPPSPPACAGDDCPEPTPPDCTPGTYQWRVTGWAFGAADGSCVPAPPVCSGPDCGDPTPPVCTGASCPPPGPGECTPGAYTWKVNAWYTGSSNGTCMPLPATCVGPACPTSTPACTGTGCPPPGPGECTPGAYSLKNSVWYLGTPDGECQPLPPPCSGPDCTPDPPGCTGEACTPQLTLKCAPGSWTQVPGVLYWGLSNGDCLPTPPECTETDCTRDPTSCMGDACPPPPVYPTCTGDTCYADPLACSPTPAPLPSTAPAAPPAAGPAFTPGFTVLAPDGRPLNNLSLSQPFLLELRVQRADIPGVTLPVTLRSPDGYEEQVVLDLVQSEPGGAVFRSATPLSIGGSAGRMAYEGTVDGLNLRFDVGTEVRTVQLLAGSFLGGTSAVQVLSNPIQQGIRANRQTLLQIQEMLATERQVAEGFLASEEVTNDEALAAETRAWLQRIDVQEGWLKQGLAFVDNAKFPIYQLRYSTFYIDKLLELGPNGLQLRSQVQHPFAVSQDFVTLANRLEADYGTNGIVPPAAMGVITGYVVGGAVTFAHVTLAAPFTQLLYGVDMFGNEASRGWAAVELGIGLALVFLPPKIIDFLASRSGRGLGFEISIGGKPTPVMLPPRPGTLAAATGRGQTAMPGAPRATPRPTRPPGVGELPPGASVSNLPARRSGLSAEDARFWQGRVEKARPDGVGPQDLAFKAWQDEQAGFLRLDEAMGTGRNNGVPQDVLDGLMTQAKEMPTVADAGDFLFREVSLELSRRQGDVLMVGSGDVNAMKGLFTPEQVSQMATCNLVPLESALVKARLQAEGRPQVWTVEEVSVLREISRRLESGEDLSAWRRAEVLETGNTLDPFRFMGFEPVFGPSDLGAIRAASVSPLRLTPEPLTSSSGPFLPGPRAPAINPIEVPNSFGGPSGLGPGNAPLEIVFRSTGGSTGSVLEAAVANYGGPVLLQSAGLVLEPLAAEQAARVMPRINQLFGAATGPGPGIVESPAGAAPSVPFGNAQGHGPFTSPDPAVLPSPRGIPGQVVRFTVDAYCLEFAKGVPTPGTLFRIASPAKQFAAARLRRILEASERLQQLAGLNPDGNPESYFHSLRQWAIWVAERGLSRTQFEGEFLGHARRNFDAAGRPWSEEIERTIRSLLPNRWRDIATVLEQAGRAAGG